MEIEYSLLENGFDFLICAINNISIAREDTTDEDGVKRLLKYALLHLSSGIELIFKHRLLKENWAYVFADMNKASKQSFASGDFKSVDSASNIERLKNLCDISLTKDEGKTLENLRKRRNKTEHFKIKESIESIEVIMCDSLSLILNFIAKHTELDTISSEESELFEQIKKETKDLEEVIAAREKIIEAGAKKDGILDDLITCPDCLSRFLHSYDGENKCLFCDYSDTPENVANYYISNVLGISAYSCMKDGDEYPIYECCECQQESMIFDYKKDVFFCFNCGFSTASSEIERCNDCGCFFISDGDEWESLCRGCIDYKMSKDG